MATSQSRGVILGYLRYVLGFDSLAFEEGLGDAEKRLKQSQKNIQKTADKIKGVGAILSVGVTAPIVGVGAAFVASMKDIAASIPELEKSAQLANVGFENFQKLAYAAKRVGFESDKLSDIYKDVNDKVGEFLATGGGEMNDFFTNVAPKVGLTAEAFRNLSGPDALQLYYNSLQNAGLSQAQMTFYMEALANDATALIPLLAENGKQMTEIGDKAAIIKESDIAQFQAYTEANREMEQSMQRLTIALVSSGILDAVTGIVTKVSEWTSELAKTNPELLKWGVGIAAIAAAVGPMMLGIGGLVSGFGAMLPLIMKIGPLFTGLAGILTSTVLPIIAAVGRALIGLAIAGGPITLVIGAVAAAIAIWKNWDTIGPIVQKLYAQVKTWLLDKLGVVWNSLKAMVSGVGDWFYNLYDRVVGHSYIPDMVDEIGQNMARLQQEMVDPAQKATQKSSDAFRDMASKISGIIDEIFPKTAELREEMAKLIALQNDTTLSPDVRQAAMDKQIARVLNAQDAARAETSSPLGNITPIDGALDDAYSVVSKAAEDASNRLRAANDNAGQSFVDMANTSLNALSNLEQAIKGGGILDILSSAFNAFGSIAKSGMLGSNLAGAFSGFSAIAGFRADGGPVSAGRTYMVGERGPELFTASRTGYIHPNGSNDNGGRGNGGTTINYYGPGAEEFWGTINANSQQNAVGAVNASNRRRDRRAARRMGR